jgi:hypothetical protein
MLPHDMHLSTFNRMISARRSTIIGKSHKEKGGGVKRPVGYAWRNGNRRRQAVLCIARGFGMLVSETDNLEEWINMNEQHKLTVQCVANIEVLVLKS